MKNRTLMDAATVALIPARLKSERLPRKPLQLLGGEPLIVQACRNAAASQCFDRVIVAADDEEVVQAVTAAGFTAVMTAPALPSGTDRVAAAAAVMDLRDETIVVNVQGDEPFVEATCLQALRAQVLARPKAVATPVTALRGVEELRDPNAVKCVLGAAHRALYFSRAAVPFERDAGQLSLKHHFRHVGVYAYTVSTLRRLTSLAPHPLEQLEKLEQLRWLAYGEQIYCPIVDESPRGIDTLSDLKRANQEWARRQARG